MGENQTMSYDYELIVFLKCAGVNVRLDNLTDTVSYTDIYKTVKLVIEGKSKNLLEALAESIANKIINEFEINSIKVTLIKPHPPIKGSIINHAAVEITRYRT